MTENNELKKLTIHDLLVIDHSLIDSYSKWKEKLNEKDFSVYNQEEIENILRNIYETHTTVSKLLEPFKEQIMASVANKQQQQPQA